MATNTAQEDSHENISGNTKSFVQGHNIVDDLGSTRSHTNSEDIVLKMVPDDHSDEKSPGPENPNDIELQVITAVPSPSASTSTKFISMPASPNTTDHLVEKFYLCDKDKDGFIEKDEFASLIEQLGTKLFPEQVTAVFLQVDKNKDGKVSLAEFQGWFTSILAHTGNHSPMTPRKKLFDISSLTDDSPLLNYTDDDDLLPKAKKTSILELIAAGYLKKHIKKQKIARTSSHLQKKPETNEAWKKEQKARRQLERSHWWGVFRAAAAGGLSAAFSGGWEIFANGTYSTDGLTDSATTTEKMSYWAIVIGSTILASLIEVCVLYYDALRTSIGFSQLAGLQLWPINNERVFIINALARSALELPNPDTGAAAFGINPLKGASRAALLLNELLYKGKAAITTFILRLAFKRIFSRLAAKTVLPLIAIPVNVVWNALVAWKVLRESKSVALGPRVIGRLVNELFTTEEDIPYHVKVAMLRVVGCVVVKKRKLHTNLHVLLAQLCSVLDLEEAQSLKNAHLDDILELEKCFTELSQEQQVLILQCCLTALVVSGSKLERPESVLFKRLYKLYGFEGHKTNKRWFWPVQGMVSRFLAGDVVYASEIHDYIVNPPGPQAWSWWKYIILAVEFIRDIITC